MTAAFNKVFLSIHGYISTSNISDTSNGIENSTFMSIYLLSSLAEADRNRIHIFRCSLYTTNYAWCWNRVSAHKRSYPQVTIIFGR